MPKAALLLIFIFNIGNCDAQINEDSLIGIWQNMPVLASGWSENYRFFDDGTFIYSHNQMDCADSIISESGKFKIKNSKLILKYKERELISGGKLVTATGSCGSEFELQGGNVETVQFIQKSVKKISSIMNDDEFDYLIFIEIDNQEFWRIDSNPKNYY